MRNFGLSLLLALSVLSCQHAPVNPPIAGSPKHLADIQHIVVIYLENHSFYNLFATFPGATNTPPAGYLGQRDLKGELYKTLPPVRLANGKTLDKRFPKDLTNRNFLIDQYVGLDQKIPDPTHEFVLSQRQIDGGKMDQFASHSTVGGLTQGYYDMSKTALWSYAKDFTLADHFFQSAFGGSFINHQLLIAAQTPRYEEGPNEIREVLTPEGEVQKFGFLTPDGYAVNTIQPFHPPYDPTEKNIYHRLPPLTYKNIGDLLSEKNISWAWYSGGWDEAAHGQAKSDFQYHHQPFLYFQNYAPDTQGRLEHLRDEKDYFKDLKNKTLPHIVFIKPTGDENAHPGYSAMDAADTKLKNLVEALQQSAYWEHSLIIITFDEYGGFWDPVAPPTVDRWGPGARIPAIFVSPFTKKHFIDHTPAETTSILSLIEARYSLPSLTDRDAHASKLYEIFE